ncbi:PF10076 family protein [Peptoanaerobacter stomatis]|uniref:PF10076 family protein n=1 Tax=Peptoanaerobacter stomatis TaxID=796937 RepID=J6H7J6_9FIRM|nr:putative phage tail protein [Peptoanaerobacter stomatis]EJU21190.1 PF10076 family protein [Peptoanaerobacter stomatis]
MIIDNIDMSLCERVELINYLPLFYRKIEQMKAVQDTLSIEVSKMRCVEKDVFLQGFVETATWGLKFFEEELGLDIEPNLSYEQRREVIKAKLRGTGTTTIKLIKNVSIAYSNGEVEVTEHNDEYYFDIKFVGTRGIPANLDGLKHILNEIKPAHLGIKYVFTFATWGEVKKLTWGDLKKMTWDEVRHLPMS